MGSQGWVIPFIKTQAVVLYLQKVTETVRIGQDSHWKQFGVATTHILISATHWLHWPCSAPSWFDRIGKKPSVRADLVIYGYMLGVSG